MHSRIIDSLNQINSPVSRFGLEGNSKRRQKLFSYLKVDTKLIMMIYANCINVLSRTYVCIYNGTENNDSMYGYSASWPLQNLCS